MADLDDIIKFFVPKKVRKKIKKNKKKWAKSLLYGLKSWLKELFGGGSSSRKKQYEPTRSSSGPTAVPAHITTAPPLTHPLQGKLEQAAAYAAAIDQQAAAAATPLARERLQTLSLHIADWQRKLAQLAQQVIIFEQNSLLQKDLKEVPKAIKSLQKRVDAEENPRVKAELVRTLTQRERQWASLEKLQSTMRLAEVKAESTVSMLGTLYSQTQISASSGQVADYRHLLAEVDEESLALQDYLDALEEIKYGQPAFTP